MAVDHCFSIRGQGTVMTGTILQGSLAINDIVEIPVLKVCSKKNGHEFGISDMYKHETFPSSGKAFEGTAEFRKFRS